MPSSPDAWRWTPGSRWRSVQLTDWRCWSWPFNLICWSRFLRQKQHKIGFGLKIIQSQNSFNVETYQLFFRSMQARLVWPPMGANHCGRIEPVIVVGSLRSEFQLFFKHPKVLSSTGSTSISLSSPSLKERSSQSWTSLSASSGVFLHRDGALGRCLVRLLEVERLPRLLVAGLADAHARGSGWYRIFR